MKPLLNVLSILLISVSTSANTQSYKDWVLNKTTDEIFQKEACIASTQVSNGSHPTQIDLSFTSDKTNLPQLTLKVWNQDLAEEKLLIKVSSKVSYPLFLWKTASTAEEPNIYWYAPIGWAPLMDYIAAANTLSIHGEQTQLNVSLRGSSVTLQRTAQCLKSSAILPLDFLKKLNAKSTVEANTYADIDQMIAGNEKAFSLYRDEGNQTAELNALLRSANKLLTQEKTAQQEYTQALNRQTTAEEALAKELALQEKLTLDISRFKTESQTLDTQFRLALQFASEKKALFEPARQQLVPYQKEVNNRQASLDRNRQNVHQLQAEIRNLESDISRLQFEEGSLNSRLRDLSYNESEAQRNYDRSRYLAAQYDVQRSVREDLSRNQRYQQHKTEVPALEKQIQNLTQAVTRLQGEITDLKQELESCRKKPNSNCKLYVDRIQNKRAAVQERKAKIEEARTKIRSAKNEIERIETATRRNHESKKAQLQNDADRDYRRYRGIASDRSETQSRYDSVARRLYQMRSDLPAKQSTLNSLQAEQQRLQTSLNQAIRNRDNLKAQIGYDRLERESRQAQNAADTLQKELEQVKNNLVRAERSLKNSQAQLVTLQKDLETKKSRSTAALNKLLPIQQELAPLRESENLIRQKISALQGEFEGQKAQYQKTYEAWISQTNVMRYSTESIGTF